MLAIVRSSRRCTLNGIDCLDSTLYSSTFSINKFLTTVFLLDLSDYQGVKIEVQIMLKISLFYYFSSSNLKLKFS